MSVSDQLGTQIPDRDRGHSGAHGRRHGWLHGDRVMSALDALYMTVITISTVGYEEVKPLGTGGRIFTMALIVTWRRHRVLSICRGHACPWSRDSCARWSGGFR